MNYIFGEKISPAEIDEVHQEPLSLPLTNLAAPWSVSFRRKVKILHLIRKEKKPYIEVTKICGENESSICETVQKEKEIRARFAAAPQTAKVTATVCDKFLVKMERALNLYNKKYWERETTFTQLLLQYIVLCYHYCC